MSVACEVWWSRPLASADDHLHTLDDTERGRFNAYRQDADKLRFLTGRLLARTAVARWLGTTPEAIAFDATCEDCGKPHGRPRVIGHDDVALSLSHSGARVGVAVTAGMSVGLDVEATSRRAAGDLITYALNDTERAALAQLAPDDAAAAFFTYWARKEALMKATGRGLKIPLRSITLSAPGEPARLVAADDAALDPAATTLLDVDPGPGYRAAVAVLTDKAVDITERWTSF
ncbi:MAG: 4'-phosphopantetheinyl transferase superfamily protein [Actinophytocola sp.]|nr:4'-phosphopantetheinyl transferase superfamily protein [Actinophytocola sp.]